MKNPQNTIEKFFVINVYSTSNIQNENMTVTLWHLLQTLYKTKLFNKKYF